MNLNQQQAEILFYAILIVIVSILLLVYIIGFSLHMSGVKLFSHKYEELNEFHKGCFHSTKVITIGMIVISALFIIYTIKGGV